MKKRIWILNHYAGNMFFDFGGRHYAFAKYLRREGYEPVVFCSNTKHGKPECFFQTEKLWEAHLAEEIDVPFVFVKARTYVGNGKQRFLNMVDFYRNVRKAAKEYAQVHGRPDVIYASSVHPLTLVAGIQLAKHYGVRCVCEVRDLWPESLIAYGYLKPEAIAVRMLRRLEKWTYKKADALIFTMEGGYDYIREQGWEREIPQSKVYHINNGVDLETFQYNREHFQIHDPDLENPDTFKVVYTGSVRKANGLKELLECAACLQEKTDIRILVYGKGEDWSTLEEMRKQRGLDNVAFKGFVQKQAVPYILSKSSLNLLNYDVNTEKVYRFGSSQNKLFEYLASGKPILANIPIAYDIVEANHCGVCKRLSTGEDYAREILKIKNFPPEAYRTLCNNAQSAAKQYDFKILTKRLLQVIEGNE